MDDAHSTRLAAEPAPTWVAALVVTGLAMLLITSNAWDFTALARSAELAILHGLAPQRAGALAGLPAPLSRLGEAAGLGLAGLGLGLLLAWRGLVVAGTALFVIVTGTQLVTIWLFRRQPLLLDTLGASAALVLAYAGATLTQLAATRYHRAVLRRTFGGALSRQNLSRLARLGGDRALRPGHGLASCLAVELGAPAMPSRSGDDDAVHLRQQLQTLAGLIETVTGCGGLVLEVRPHGFVAYWNVALAEPQHAVRACAAANLLMQRTRAIKPVAGQSPDPGVELHIGIASARFAAGGVGPSGHIRYLVDGSCRTLATQLRDQTRYYGASVLACARTRQAAALQFGFLELDPQALSAAGEPMPVFALIGTPATAASPKFRALATFHDRLFLALRNQQWATARELVAQCRKLSGASPKLYDLYTARIARLEQAGPNRDGRDGVREPAA